MIKRNEKDIYIQYLGGASEVGATSIFLYWKGERILIDSGARQVKDKYPIFEEINDDIDLFILTHLHGDHVGSLMECENKLNLKRMITSPDNKSMLKIALEDSQKILKSDFEKEKNEIKKQEIEKKLDIYSSENIDRVIRKMETKDFYKTIYLGKTNLKITFYKTSHLWSASAINEYINYFLSKNEIEEVKKYQELLKKLNETTTFSKIFEIYNRTTEYYDEYQDKLEEKNNEEILREYIITKLQEMGDEIYIDEDGKIISPKGENDLVIEIEKDNLKLDIPGKGRSCVSTMMEFERITKNELKKGKMEWHTLEKEKKIKKSINKVKRNLNFNQVYDKKLMEKRK